MRPEHRLVGQRAIPRTARCVKPPLAQQPSLSSVVQNTKIHFSADAPDDRTCEFAIVAAIGYGVIAIFQSMQHATG